MKLACEKQRHPDTAAGWGPARGAWGATSCPSTSSAENGCCARTGAGPCARPLCPRPCGGLCCPTRRGPTRGQGAEGGSSSRPDYARAEDLSVRCRHREGNDGRNSQGKMESHVRGQNRERNQSRHRPGSLAVTLHARPPPGPGCPRVGAAAPRPVPRAQLWTGSSQPSSQDCPPEPHASRGSGAATTRRRLLRPCPARRRAGEQAHAVTRTSNGGAECHRRHRGGAS